VTTVVAAEPAQAWVVVLVEQASAPVLAALAELASAQAQTSRTA